MTIMTVVVQDVIEYDLSVLGRSSTYPAKITPPPPPLPRYQNIRSVNIHTRLFCFAYLLPLVQ